ncbi:hypothetical protein [Hydrocarboniphaga effusa]|uniref:hypothetical protein n=1 Tax=Hydrocarboniphaga effusa TaxID=243629 RepID=UPI003BAC9F00
MDNTKATAKALTEKVIEAKLEELNLTRNEDGSISGELKRGLTIGPDTHKTFTVREGTAADLFNAEKAATAEKAVSYRAAVLCQQLVKVGSFEGPFTLSLLGKLSSGDLNRLHTAQDMVDTLGEVAPRG